MVILIFNIEIAKQYSPLKAYQDVISLNYKSTNKFEKENKTSCISFLFSNTYAYKVYVIAYFSSSYTKILNP